MKYHHPRVRALASQLPTLACVGGSGASNTQSCEGGSGFSTWCNDGPAAVQDVDFEMACFSGTRAVGMEYKNRGCVTGTYAGATGGAAGCEPGITPTSTACAEGTGVL